MKPFGGHFQCDEVRMLKIARGTWTTSGPVSLRFLCYWPASLSHSSKWPGYAGWDDYSVWDVHSRCPCSLRATDSGRIETVQSNVRICAYTNYSHIYVHMTFMFIAPSASVQYVPVQYSPWRTTVYIRTYTCCVHKQLATPLCGVHVYWNWNWSVIVDPHIGSGTIWDISQTIL